MKLNPLAKTKTLGSILGTFTATLKDLDALIARNNAAYEKNNAALSAIVSHNAELDAEKEQASRVADRIKELVA